ncbi:MAG: hypothetical protein HPY62_00330 [Bacteroidales bacterium]|nr:hypothetical protein [Bacteroidales bacterium]
MWTSEVKELEKLYESFKGQLPELEKELGRLIKADDENMILLYSRRCLEVIISDLCKCELNRDRGTEPLKGIIDRLNKEKKVPSHIITSMHGLNDLSTYGTHPKDFDPEQVKPVLVNLDIIIKWYLKYKDFKIAGKPEPDESKPEDKQSTVSTLEKSIIVLPFENMSPDPDQEYFSDGLTEEIITDLSHIHDLLVISRSSAMTFKGTKKKIVEIAKEVNVRFVLEGSVRKAGDNLRITAQLIDAITDVHLWAEKFTGTLEDVFAIQEKVSHSITEALKLKLFPDERKQLISKGTKSLKAFELCLRSRHYRNMYTQKGINQAIELLEQALIEDPDYALAYAEIATCYWGLGTLGHIPPGEAYPRIKETVMDALKIDNNLAEAHLLLGFYCWDYEWNWTAAEKEFVQAVRLKPGDSWVHVVYSWFLGQQRRHQEAVAEMHKALELDPLSISTATCIGEELMFARESDLAIEQCKSVISKDATYWVTHAILGVAYMQKGLSHEAVEALEKAVLLADRDIFPLSLWGYSLGVIGKTKEAQEILDELLKIRKTKYLSPFWIATVHMGLGEYERALDWLQTGYEERAAYMYCIHLYVQFDPLHNDPRFINLCHNINLVI